MGALLGANKAEWRSDVRFGGCLDALGNLGRLERGFSHRLLLISWALALRQVLRIGYLVQNLVVCLEDLLRAGGTIAHSRSLI